jgi:hypothetical protein
MDEAEGLEVVREFLFRTLDAFPRFRPLRKKDLQHSFACCGPAPTFKATPAEHLTDHEYLYHTAIQVAAPLGAVLEVRRHAGWCESEGCKAHAAAKSVQVSLVWQGKKLSRAYQLDKPVLTAGLVVRCPRCFGTGVEDSPRGVEGRCSVCGGAGKDAIARLVIEGHLPGQGITFVPDAADAARSAVVPPDAAES